MATGLLGKTSEQEDDLISRTREFGPEILVLGGDANRTGVQVALTNHLAAKGEQGKSAEAEPLRPQQRGDHDVASGAQPAVGFQQDPLSLPVGRQHLVCFGETELPRRAGVFDRDQWRGTGAAFGA